MMMLLRKVAKQFLARFQANKQTLTWERKKGLTEHQRKKLEHCSVCNVFIDSVAHVITCSTSRPAGSFLNSVSFLVYI